MHSKTRLARLTVAAAALAAGGDPGHRHGGVRPGRPDLPDRDQRRRR